MYRRVQISAHPKSDPVQAIKDLYVRHDARNVTPRLASSCIKKANGIYGQIPDDKKDHYIMNTMIKLFLHFEQPNHITHIWTDIIALPPSQLSKLSYPILLKCLVTSMSSRKGNYTTLLFLNDRY